MTDLQEQRTTMVPWEKVERLIAAGNRLADELDLREEHPDGKTMAEVLEDWDRARYALAPEQETARADA